MIDIKHFMTLFQDKLNDTFGSRVWFVGLQGSYGRGEATKSSDIDVVVILDRLSVADLNRSRAMLDTLPHRDLVCGFLSGKDEIEIDPYFDHTLYFNHITRIFKEKSDFGNVIIESV